MGVRDSKRRLHFLRDQLTSNLRSFVSFSLASLERPHLPALISYSCCVNHDGQQDTPNMASEKPPYSDASETHHHNNTNANEPEVEHLSDHDASSDSKHATTAGGNAFVAPTVAPLAHVPGTRSRANSLLIRNAKAATDKEHKMTLWQGIKLYPKAVGWSMLISLCIAMEGFDLCLLGTFGMLSLGAVGLDFPEEPWGRIPYEALG